jgi:hypothetical protein
MDQFKNNGAGAFRAAREMVPGKDHHFMGKTMRQMRDPVNARLGHNIASLESLWLVCHFELKIPDQGVVKRDRTNVRCRNTSPGLWNPV